MLVTFEGIDGSGKSTISRLLYDRLKREGLKISYIEKGVFDHPNQYLVDHMTSLSSLIWDVPIGSPEWDLGDEHWFLLVNSWFCAFQRLVLAPKLENNDIVLLDNWVVKFFAKFYLKNNFNHKLVSAMATEYVKPDLTIFLDIPSSSALHRKSGELNASELGKFDGYDGTNSDFIHYQDRLKSSILSCVDPSKLITVSSDRPMLSIVEEISINLKGKIYDGS